MGRDWQNFEERPRKVHLYHDQQGAEYAPGRKYTNTLCKGNFNHDGLLFTDDPTKVTCQSCLKKIRRSRRAFGVTNPSTATPVITIHASSIRYRQTLTGKLVLQIKTHYRDDGYKSVDGWRDATLSDLNVGVV